MHNILVIINSKYLLVNAHSVRSIDVKNKPLILYSPQQSVRPKKLDRHLIITLTLGVTLLLEMLLSLCQGSVPLTLAQV